MSENHYGGNIVPEITREEHDGVNNAKRVNVVAGGVGQATVNIAGAATIYAVVNTGAAGDSVANIGFATVSVSNPTLYAVVNTSAPGVGNSIVTIANTPLDTRIIGNVTLSDSKTYIGLTTATIGSSIPAGVNAIGFATVYQASSARTITGNLTLSDSKTFIGLTTTTLGASPAFIGVVTVTNKDRTITGNVTLSDAKTYIGLVTATVGSIIPGVGATNLGKAESSTHTTGDTGVLDLGVVNANYSTLAAEGEYAPFMLDQYGRQFVNVDTIGPGAAFIGIVTVANKDRTITGNVTLSDAKTFIGLTTAWARNAGTTKTLVPLNFSFAQASVTTIAVPSNTFNITSFIANANATVGLRIKSGATYLIGNVSLSVMLNPGGGWVQHGAPDSPVYKGLAGAAAIVVEKEDFGQVAEIAGHLIYFDE